MFDEVDVPEAIALLERAVKERGEDYVYPDAERSAYGECQYFIGRAPGCLIGLVMTYVGADAEDANEGEGVSSQNWPVNLTPGAISVFSLAQEVQDQGGTWGQAFAEASSFRS